LSILLAATSDGRSYFQYLDGNNNELSVSSYFISLAEELDRDYPNWREDHLLLLDNCTSHTTELVMKVMGAAGYNVMFSSPASYLVLPIESILALLKK
jgi:hypothetical protein